MNIALCTDDNYALPCMITIVSILENNKDENCVIFVLTDSLNYKNEELFRYLSNYYSQEIRVIKIDCNTFSNLKVRSRYPKSMYYRFLLPELVKENKILYLDCDIIVRHSLRDFFNLDLNEWAAAVVEDAQGDDVLLHNRIKYSGLYFNSGVMLINLDYWRRNKITEKLVNFILENPERCYYPDQDALNIVLEDKVYFTSYKYNFQQIWYSDLVKVQFLYTKSNAVIEAADDPIIVHYTSTNKPWFRECTHPHKEWFLEYATIHDNLCYKEKHRIPLVKSIVSRVCEWIVFKINESNLIVIRK